MGSLNHPLALILLLSAPLLFGCGSSPSASTPPTYPSLSGNWEFTGLSATGLLTSPIANSGSKARL